MSARSRASSRLRGLVSRWGLGLGMAALPLGAPQLFLADAQAFCGFFVTGADAAVSNNASQVALLRKGSRTVLTMSNNYKGPPEDFAMVVPVPVVLHKEGATIGTATAGSATGLGRFGRVRLFAAPHTEENYLLQEMGYKVARKHALKLRRIAWLAGFCGPILALLIAPLATELPEMSNSFLWLYRKKDRLAVGNVTGAMVFQGSIPVSVGLLGTEWTLGTTALATMVLAVIAMGLSLLQAVWSGHWRPWLLSGSALLYLGYTLFLYAHGS